MGDGTDFDGAKGILERQISSVRRLNAKDTRRINTEMRESLSLVASEDIVMDESQLEALKRLYSELNESGMRIAKQLNLTFTPHVTDFKKSGAPGSASRVMITSMQLSAFKVPPSQKKEPAAREEQSEFSLSRGPVAARVDAASFDRTAKETEDRLFKHLDRLSMQILGRHIEKPEITEGDLSVFEYAHFDGFYNRDGNSITLSPDYDHYLNKDNNGPESRLEVVMAHELGHALVHELFDKRRISEVVESEMEINALNEGLANLIGAYLIFSERGQAQSRSLAMYLAHSTAWEAYLSEEATSWRFRELDEAAQSGNLDSMDKSYLFERAISDMTKKSLRNIDYYYYPTIAVARAFAESGKSVGLFLSDLFGKDFDEHIDLLLAEMAPALEVSGRVGTYADKYVPAIHIISNRLAERETAHMPETKGPRAVFAVPERLSTEQIMKGLDPNSYEAVRRSSVAMLYTLCRGLLETDLKEMENARTYAESLEEDLSKWEGTAHN